MSKDNRADITVEEIPLPPPELWGELDNSGGQVPPANAADAKTASAAPAKPTFVPRERETLEFKGDKWRKVITLEFPFDHPVLGDVAEITVRRLTVGEIGEAIDSREYEAPDNFDIYERMTGVPAAVLRGLIDTDGEAVTGVCFDFLPRLFRPNRQDSGSSSTSPTGEE